MQRSQLDPPGKLFIVGAIVVVALLVGYTIYESSSAPGSVTTQVPSRFSVNGRTFAFTYVATTQQERQTGLMNKKVTNTTTMLFAFPYSSNWAFWMYDTNTSLDMIWVNSTGGTGRVVYLVAGAQPCFNALGYGCPTYTPSGQANYVIEAKAGFAAANGITKGTSVLFG
jgi:uncharacterized membrane protein (UPF0127 family)